jgi:hypothetical protein
MESLDLDITNYSIKDLERFFKLSNVKEYIAADIELREYELREQLLKSGTVNKKMKRDLIDFLTKAKNWLIYVKCNNAKEAPTTLPKVPRLDNSNYPMIPDMPYHRQGDLIDRKQTQYVNTMNSEYYPGTLNPLATRIITKCLTIDTRFRDNFYSTQSSDLTIQLPTKLTKVVSMQLSSIEIPITFYGICESYGNNFLYLEVTYQLNQNSPVETDTRIVFLPDGNYNASDLIFTINTILSPVEDDGITLLYPNSPYSYIQLVLDITATGSGTGKVYIQASGTLASMIQNIKLDFTRDKFGDVDNIDLSRKLGWNLGFTGRIYDGNTLYLSDTVIEPVTVRYLYLAIDDFNNSVNNHFMTAFNKSILSPNVLARISLKGSYFTLIMENDLNIVTEPRKYFGPVDIQRLRIQILDDHGRILPMNNANYSFCLVFKQLYDM